MAEQAGKPKAKGGDLSVTALYTSYAWFHGGFEAADLFVTRGSKIVFQVTNFVLKLASFFKPGPVLASSLAQRHAMFDRVVEDSKATQVVEIAAGLSQRGAVFSKDPGVRYVEIDLPRMVAAKRKILARSDLGTQILQRPNLTLAEADLREADLTSYVEASGPACIVAEGLFMYLTAEEQRSLWRRVVEALAKAPSGTFAFDLVPAGEEWHAGVVGQVLERLLKHATRGSTFVKDERSRHDIATELKNAGFEEVDLLEPDTLLSAWNLPFPEARTQVLLFRCSTNSIG